MAGLNVLTYLTAYLDACGRNGGKPLTGPDLDRFLPWNAAPETSVPGHSRRHARINPANSARTGVLTNRSRRLSACPITGLPNTYVRSGRLRFPDDGQSSVPLAPFDDVPHNPECKD